ncbi:MAG: YggS family pyridoxal phosphate-dependent enzyme [Saprospiraceae bacterium]
MISDIKAFREELEKNGVSLVAVSKTQSNEAVRDLYGQGQRIFGENKVQELLGKKDELPADIQWHVIGHLQTNKVKYIADFVAMIHSVDSLKVLKEINKQAKKVDRVIPVLLQFHIAEEDTKFGLDWQEAEELLNSEAYLQMSNIEICGVMGMATFTEDESQVRREFKALTNIFNQLKTAFFPDSEKFKEISMGMSGDYKLAMEEGSTIVRIGSLLFGERTYG